MKLTTDLFVFILLVFIKIGDFVLFIISFPFRIIKQLLIFVSQTSSVVLRTLKNIAKKTFPHKKEILIFESKPKTMEKKPKKRLKKKFRFPSFHLPLFSFPKPSFSFFTKLRKKIIYKKKKTILAPQKIKKPKRLATFQLPFLLKFRYFFVGFFFSTCFIFVPLVLVIFLQDIPSPKELLFRSIPQTTKIYDRNGILLYQIYASQNRTLVALSDIPINLKQATIAIEDKDFYKHPGFDLVAIARATYINLSGKDIQGGSTITQQLIKSALLSSEQTILRKIKELVIAFLAEKIYTKDQILEMYFNQVPYGGTAWGVEAASEKYFGKSVKELDLSQSAFLAGMPGAPTLYSPYNSENKTLWKKRQKEVLNHMLLLGFINSEQKQQAEEEELSFINEQPPIRAPHFVLYVKDLLTKKYGLAAVERGGLNVITSLDLNLQEQVQKIVKEEVEKASNLHLTNGASVITNPQNGDILAMIGSIDFNSENSGNVNVTISFRQPGSSIKVVTYALALSKGYTAATILDDSPITFTNPYGQSYSPVNYDGKFHGRVPLRLALGNSFNVPAIRTINQLGVPSMVELGKKMGIKSWGLPNQYGVSITLGSAEVTMLDMANVYAVLSNGGVRVDVNPLLRVTDYKGNVLEEKSSNTQSIVNNQRVLDEGVAYILSDILADNSARVLEFGQNSPLNIPGKKIPVKTGTSDNKRDNWTIGYYPKRLVAVWVGNNDGSPMNPALASGITGAAPIWNRIMNLISSLVPVETIKMPSDIVSKSCLGRIEYFIKGTENSVNCTPITPPSTPTPTPTP